MKEKFKEICSGIGMVVVAFVMMLAAAGIIVLVTKIFHTNK